MTLHLPSRPLPFWLLLLLAVQLSSAPAACVLARVYGVHQRLGVLQSDARPHAVPAGVWQARGQLNLQPGSWQSGKREKSATRWLCRMRPLATSAVPPDWSGTAVRHPSSILPSGPPGLPPCAPPAGLTRRPSTRCSPATLVCRAAAASAPAELHTSSASGRGHGRAGAVSGGRGGERRGHGRYACGGSA